MSADKHHIKEINDISKKVVKDKPDVVAGVDVKWESKWDANCIVEDTQAHKTRPDMEKISCFLKRKEKGESLCQNIMNSSLLLP